MTFDLTLSSLGETVAVGNGLLCAAGVEGSVDNDCNCLEDVGKIEVSKARSSRIWTLIS